MLLALADLVQGRLRDIDMAALDQLPHLAEEKRQQESSNMGPIHVRIGHDDDAVIAQFVRIELLLADATTESGDNRAHFRGAEHLVEARFFHVQDLAFQGQDCLVFAVAALLGRTARGVALHEVQLGQRRILLLAIRQFSRQPGDVQGALAAGHLPRLARRFPGPGRVQHLADDGLGFRRVLQQVIVEGGGHRLFHG